MTIKELIEKAQEAARLSGEDAPVEVMLPGDSSVHVAVYRAGSLKPPRDPQMGALIQRLEVALNEHLAAQPTCYATILAAIQLFHSAILDSVAATACETIAERREFLRDADRIWHEHLAISVRSTLD